MRKSPSIVNAFNDMRISGASPMKQANETLSRMKNAPSKKNLATLGNSTSKKILKLNHDTDEEPETEQHLWMLKDLDFDKIVRTIDEDI